MSGQWRAVLVACGREIGARDIENIKEVVGLCSGLSQEELAHTICEHLSLVTASGRHKVKGCLRLLEKLDDLGEIQLPAKRVLKTRKSDIAWTRETAPRPEMSGELSDVGKVALTVVSGKHRHRRAAGSFRLKLPARTAKACPLRRCCPRRPLVSALNRMDDMDEVDHMDALSTVQFCSESALPCAD